MSKRTKATIAVTLIASSVYLSGCGLIQFDKKEKIDPPQSVSYENGKTTAKSTAANKNQVQTELYLIDKNGYVVPQTFALPNSKSVAKQALEYLVKDGPVENILPNGFRSVLPANTQVDVDVKNGVATVDFSKDFDHYKGEDEQKIIESVTWTLTQFDSIKKVKMQVDGVALKNMPVNKTPLNADGLTRASAGINIDTNDVADITNTHPVTVYYLAQYGQTEYYVPVTRRISNDETNDVKAAVEQLVKGPDPGSNLVSGFMDDVSLLKNPQIKDGKVTLDFNKEILGSLNKKTKMISNEVLNPLVLTLTEQKGIKSVAVEVDGSTKLVTENGKQLTEPVLRPEKVNTGSF
ncbi:GerMN domain-containing protein [Heyndrickxia ginsengihumi]|uniref:Sporulation protein n=1 Tax=Heyndrickxia ginsengihumi TaxID=363870 RepID=A0A0A6VJZ0_9BACI|nr:GerMN domain-containing protein [Heyndrickxia ginsengihumi]KHD86929.1 sporulation protein [Heyndrickxia ginsengihumi]MBE6182741.1 sporulation protein [Bacillus sp. (in: firmicutes)]MCM3021946.1 GerMN domain-containing protein [Heyndrickxia ginsengihumi]NEY20861.1 sporulation protein [Heyndrickxia ginsengihumi]